MAHLHLRQNPKKTFHQWLQMKIENENGIYKDQDNKTVTNKEFIIYFHNTILNILHDNGYIIDNDKTKSFKNEIATFIYKYSDNSSQ